MRRILSTAGLALLLTSCFGSPVYVDDPTVRDRRSGVRSTGGGAPCREVSRSRCDTAACKGSGMDLVTLQCGGTKIARCQIGKGGCG